MKILKYLSISTLLLSSMAVANAQNVLYIAGSTANRAPADAAIISLFDSAPITNSDGTLGGEHSSIFSGQIGGAAWIVKTAWTGSENGVQLASSNLTASFLDNSAIGGSSQTNASNVTGLTTATAGTNELHTADGAFADTFAAASQFQGTVTNSDGSTTTYTAPTEVTSGSVAINVFKWFTNNGAPSGLNNVTSQIVRKIYATGKVPLSFFTGADADLVNSVYAVGRNPDSGTRVTSLLETGAGTAKTVVTQYAPEIGGAVVTSGYKPSTGTGLQLITSLAKYPATTTPVDKLSFGLGNNGYSSGGQLAAALNNDYTNGGAGITIGSTTYNNGTTPAHTLSVIAYISSNDADSLIAASGTSIVELAFNGVKLGKYSDYNTATPLTDGAYTFWSYEHLYIGNNVTGGSTGAQAGLVNTLATNLPTAPSLTGFPPAVKTTSMKVTRSSDGAVISAATTVY